MLALDLSLATQSLHSIFKSSTAFDSASPVGLLDGLGGSVLYGWFLCKHDSTPGLDLSLHSAIERLQENAPLRDLPPNLTFGTAGLGYLFELLLWEQEDDYNPDFNANTDCLLEAVTNPKVWSGDLEYVLGISGIAVYANRRLRQAGRTALCENILSIFEHNVITLAPDQLAWSTPRHSPYRVDKDSHQHEFTLSLAHGVPAIIAALLPMLHHEGLRQRAAPLIEGACNWLLAQRQNADEYGSHYGYHGGTQRVSRLGWCYGDPGISITLARAGEALSRADYIRVARDVALHAARRRGPDTGIHDAGLCHGSAGLLLMFQRLHQLLGDHDLLQAAQFWLDDTMARYRQKGLDGFDKFTLVDNKPAYQATSEVLGGRDGVGLCLLAALGVEATWADLFLLDDPK